LRLAVDLDGRMAHRVGSAALAALVERPVLVAPVEEQDVAGRTGGREEAGRGRIGRAGRHARRDAVLVLVGAAAAARRIAEVALAQVGAVRARLTGPHAARGDPPAAPHALGAPDAQALLVVGAVVPLAADRGRPALVLGARGAALVAADAELREQHG